MTVLSLTAEKMYVPVGGEMIQSAASTLTSKLFYLLAVAFSGVVILFRINDVTKPGLWRIAVVLAPWLVALTRNFYAGGSVTPDSVLYLMVMLALAALRPEPRRVLVVVGALLVLTAVGAIALGVFLPDAGILREADGTIRDRPDKATFPSLGLLVGMFPAEVNLAVYLASGAAAVAALPRAWLRFPGLAIIAFATIWSSGRGAMLAMACSLLTGVAVWALTEFGWRRAASMVARTVAGIAITVMCVLPLMGWDAEAFSARGEIWSGSLAQWSSREFLFGLGHDWYLRAAESDTSTLNPAAYEGHNLFVQFLATGGVVLAFFAVGRSSFRRMPSPHPRVATS